MGTSKSEIFSEEQNELATMAKALSHPARIAIVQHLMDQNSCMCGDIVEEIGLAQSTVSQHLKELKNSGIIKGNVEGVKVCYCIDWERWKKTGSKLMGFLNRTTNECC